MRSVESLSHSRWECKYHIVFIPKYRKKVIFGQIRTELGEVFPRLAKQRECEIEESHLMPDHVHMMISIPPYLRWLDLSKGKVRSILPECTLVENATMSGRDFGREGTLYRLWVVTNRLFEISSSTRKLKIVG